MAHLIERAAERLRAESGLVDAIPQRPIERQVDRPTDRLVERPDDSQRASRVVPDSPVPMSEPIDEAVRSNRDANESGRATDAILIKDAPAHHDRAPGVDVGLPVVAAPEPPAPRMLDISTLERNGLVVGRKSRTRISEEFRIAVGHVLRTLQTSYTAGHGASNLILVTSSRPGEGKSFTALNLAGCIAQQDNRDVLLVDTDAKQRPITYELGLSDAPGLLDLVRNPSMRVDDVIVPTAIPSLSFIPIGARLTGNAEMPLSRPITAVVERLARRFANRVIILDAPPCLSASDPSAFAPIVGQTVMVVEAERTQRNELEAALDMVRVCPTITLLLNKIQLTTSYTFGAYHYFGSYS